MKVISGGLDGSGLRFGIVVSRFNDLVASRLLEGALDALLRHGVADAAITVVWVPGALEIPLVASRLANDNAAVICLGCVIRGQTPHFEHVAANCAAGVSRVGLESGVPVIFGVLTTETLDQALERAGSKQGNKGWDAAVAAIEMARIIQQTGT